MFAPQLSELIILIVARHLDCDYEWSVHAPICGKTGVPAHVIEAIGKNTVPVFEDPAQQAVYDFVSQLLTRNRVDDAGFAAFHSMFGERGVVEATAVMGYYCTAGFALNAVGMLPNGEALPPRQT
jgi:4-carboxymuconolactone decarboxylase